MPLEVELKYAADGPEPLERLARIASLGPAELGPARTATEVDRYLDTPDRRLAATRWACRLRERDGGWRISLKGPPATGSADGLHRRPEVEGPASESTDPTTWPPGEARELLDRLRAGGPLQERFMLEQERTERAVLVDGHAVGTLTLDRVRVLSSGDERGRLRAVELELHAPDDEAGTALLTELDRALRAVGGLHADERTKLEHALVLIGER